MGIGRIALLPSLALLGFALTFSISQRAMAQSQPLKDDMVRLAMDLHGGVERSTLTAQQKAQFRDDFRELRRARRNHEMFAEFRAMRSIRATLDSGAFKPEDRKRIKQDLQALRKAREARHHPGM